MDFSISMGSNPGEDALSESESGIEDADVYKRQDLTGANATGVLLKKMNYKAYTVMNTERIELETLSDCDCVLYPTDSRGVESEIAYNRVYNVCNLLKNDEVKVYSKRIDSTLRGNLGSETDAMLDGLGEDYVAIVAPCFPSSGRIVIGGYMLVEGIPCLLYTSRCV